MNPLIPQILQQIFLLTTDTQHIHIKFITESGLLDGLVNQTRGRHQYYFSDTYIIKIKRIGSTFRLFRSVIIQYIEQVIFGKLLYFIKFSRHIQNIFRFQHSIRFGKFLSNSLQKTMLRGVSTTDFHNVESIFTTNIQIKNSLSQKKRIFYHLHTEQVARKSIFIYQFF